MIYLKKKQKDFCKREMKETPNVLILVNSPSSLADKIVNSCHQDERPYTTMLSNSHLIRKSANKIETLFNMDRKSIIAAKMHRCMITIKQLYIMYLKTYENSNIDKIGQNKLDNKDNKLIFLE